MVEGTIPSKMRTITIPDWQEDERGYRLSAERIAELIAEYVRYRQERQIPQPYLDIVSALSELAAYRRHVQGFTPETSTQPDIVGEYEAWIAEIAGDTEFCTPCVDKLAEYLQRKPQKSNWICACGHANATTVTLKVTHCSKCEAVRSTQEMK